MHILLVEDSRTEARLIRDLLGRSPLLGTKDPTLTVEEVDCLAAALERLATGDIDLVLLDLVLPDSQGLDTFLPVHTQAPDVPIIILSGLDAGGLAVEAVRQGAQDYLVKGQMDEHLLARAIRYAVERKRAEEMLRIQRDLGFALSAVRGLDETLHICLDAALELPGMDCGGIYLVDPDSGSLHLAVHEGLSTEFVARTSSYAADTPQAGRVRAGQAAHIRYQDIGVTMDDVRRREGLRAISIIPVRHQGQIIACFNVASHTVDQVPESVFTALEAIGNSVGSAIARSQMEESLQHSAATLQSILRAAPVGIGLVRDCVILWTNDTLHQMLGYSGEELRGQSARMVYESEEEFARVGREKYAGIARYGTGTIETRFRHKDGRLIDVLLSSTPEDPRDLSQGVIFTALDITERQEAATALRESQEWLATTLRSIGDAVIATDRRGSIQFINPVAQGLTGWGEEEAQGRPLAEVFKIYNEGTGALAESPVARVLREGVVVALANHTVLQTREGQHIPIADSGAPIRDAAGEIGGVVLVFRDVTERCQAEKALREERDRAQQYLDIAGVILVALDTAGRVSLVNRKGCELLEGSESEIVGRNWFDHFLVASERQEVKAVFEQLMAGKMQPVEYFENSIWTRSGRVRRIAWRNTVLRDEGGHILGSLSSGEDVTEKRRAEESVRRQAEILVALHETALELAAQQSLPELLGAIVARATSLLQGQGGGLYLYRPATDDLEYVFSFKIQPDYTGSVLRRGEGLSGKVWDCGKPIAVEDYSRWKGRTSLYEGADFGAIVGVPIYWQGRFLGVLNVQHTAPHTFSPEDVAILERFAPLAAAALENARLLAAERERRQVAETLQRAAAALGATLELDEVLELILKQLRQVIPYDSASVQRLRDDVLEIVAGQGFIDSAAVTGLAFSLTDDFPNRRVVEEKLPIAFADVGKHYPSFRSDADVYRSGHIRSWLGVPLLVRDQVIGMLALDRTTVHPFTAEECDLALSFAHQAAMAIENARLYGDLQQQMEQLKQAQLQLLQTAKLAAVGELAAGVAHEINNPLTNVLGYAELLLQDKPEGHPDAGDLRTIATEARRARDIVRNLLDFARQTRPQRQPSNVNEILRQTLSVIRYHLEKSGIVITEDYAGVLPQIPLDEGQIKQVLLNLITNAAHAMPDGGTLRLRTMRTGDEVTITVADTGAGIPPELLEHIFDPFFTTKPTGTGLGLSVSLGIVQNHGGRITVESTVGAGSTFTLWLPVTS
jgi:PAS domain S-box-containing protein